MCAFWKLEDCHVIGLLPDGSVPDRSDADAAVARSDADIGARAMYCTGVRFQLSESAVL